MVTPEPLPSCPNDDDDDDDDDNKHSQLPDNVCIRDVYVLGVT